MGLLVQPRAWSRSVVRRATLGVVYALSLPGVLAGQRPQPQLVAALVARVDGSAENLTPITALAIQPDGTIMAAQPQDGLIRMFTAAGRAAGSFGRAGEGPKEFRWINTMGWVAETLWVNDDMQHRVTYLAGGKTFLRTEPMPRLPELDPGGKSVPRVSDFGPVALLPGGWSLRSGLAERNEQPPAWKTIVRGTEVFSRVSPSGGFDRVVAAVLGPATQCKDRKLGVPIPECGGALWAVASTGGRIGVALPVVRDRRSPQVRLILISAQGDTITDHVYPIHAIPLSSRSADSIRTDRINNSHSAAAIAGWKAVKIPPYFRPFEFLVVGREGSLWLGQHADKGERAWLVVGPTGVTRGTVMLPGGVRIQIADGDDIWGTTDDEDDVESIVHYRIRQGR